MSIERRLAAIAALVLVNVFAITGQATWAYAHLGRNWLVAGAFAATLESVALYLTAMASAATLANDRAGTLRAAAYGVGILVGGMNYVAHAAPHWQPTPMAIAFGALSALSPWLWAVQSRRTHRDQLAAAGLIDPRTVKVPAMLWLLYPGHAFALLRLGVRSGTNHLPTLRAELAERVTLRRLVAVDAVRYAFGATGSTDPHAARVWLAQRGVYVTAAQLDQVAPARSVAARAALPVPATPAAPVARQDAPGRPNVPAPVSPAPLGQVDRQDAAHAAELAAATSKRQRIRLAYAHLGPVSAGTVVRHLARHGVKVARSEASAVARTLDLAAAAGTGEYPVVPVSLPTLARVNGSRPELVEVAL